MNNDLTIKCIDCSRDFYFTERDQNFFKEKGFSNPKRCKNCRNKKKAQNGGGIYK